ncbi:MULTISPECIES: endonuclease/exonuclease/phosphatase family protein [unclassified Arenibacter]|uniref:endonuclease/exonuclease/phosphatase family protein n=1 Tax=unclassified Arenibacter TaxID=2615047 RepID=UPI000E3502A6|nr:MULTISPECIES: endonuclease/exonuclease/phosphatase family protein [unclassified Arenibacter]MCM4163909.1 endonuclease [Arenibacter sp. A80]RFT56615.1 endonuclease/exonuclease/phosphatase family protein [Arenibacter sp. P308M17]
MNIFFTLFVVYFTVGCALAQEAKTYRIRTVAFYNLENLFDTANDPLILDDDRTPDGKDNWTMARYRQKIHNMTKVLSEIGSSDTQTSPDIIGLCELENRQVLEDLITHPHLREMDYGIVHFDSPDKRGIDVALLYKKAVFLPSSFASLRLVLTNENDYRVYTRDQLAVGGILDGEQIHLIVNHWPSRSGGEAKSRPYRIAAAKLNKRILDSISKIHPDTKIIGMGDFNDDPMDDSFKKILKAKGKVAKLEKGDLFNPMEMLFKKGIGSLAYRDRWNLFDQIYITANITQESQYRYRFWKAGIYNPTYLIDKKGQYKGYPLRTYAGGNYIGGYSDHFPVYIHLIKAVN